MESEIPLSGADLYGVDYRENILTLTYGKSKMKSSWPWTSISDVDFHPETSQIVIGFGDKSDIVLNAGPEAGETYKEIVVNWDLCITIANRGF